MATVTTTIAPQLRTQPFTGIALEDREFSNAPRAEIWSAVLGQNVAATGAADNQRIVFNMSMPTGFAYILAGANFRIYPLVANTNNFDARGWASWRNDATGASATQLHAISLETDGKVNDVGIETYVFEGKNLPSQIVRPANAGSVCFFQALWYNATANDVAYEFDCNVRFLQYDLRQAESIYTNSPGLTRGAAV